jgi:hypothetical protein
LCVRSREMGGRVLEIEAIARTARS